MWRPQSAYAFFLPEIYHSLILSTNTVGPIVTSETARSAELDVSLLERLFERPLYAENPHARSAAFTNSPRRQNSFTPFTNLVKVCGLQGLVPFNFQIILGYRITGVIL